MSGGEKEKPRQKWISVLLGAAAANGVLFLFIYGPIWFLNTLTARSVRPDGLVLASVGYVSFFFGMLAAGLVASWFWRSLQPLLLQTLWLSLFVTLVGILASAIFLGEGVVCLVIASPLLWGGIFAGASIGRVWFRPHSSKLRLSILPVIGLMALGERANYTEQESEIVDEIIIKASPEQIWPHLLAFSDIKEPPHYWVFRMGLPYPVATTNDGNFVGADRNCIFSDGIVIKERIAEFEPGKRLTFDITGQPDHPEAYGHITLRRGQFDLRANGDGTTTLIGTSWYTLHVRPWRYFDWWAADMTRAVHLRVMRHIQRVAEGGEGAKG